MEGHISARRRAALAAVVIGGVLTAATVTDVRADRAETNRSVSYNCTSGQACVEGNASGKATAGVSGSSIGTHTYGVYGESNATGVMGYTTSTNGGSGVSGISGGTTGSAHGVYGKALGSRATGVYGVDTGGGFGIYGEAFKTGIAIGATGENSSTDLFVVGNSATNGECIIDPNADLSCTGMITQSRQTRGGRRVLAYASESAGATIEDVNTARMINGVANVRIDPAFASVMDGGWYYVFLTPLGDTRGLYVSVKTASGFQVRENERGHSNVAFDYRVVAHPLGTNDDRLPDASATAGDLRESSQ